MTVTAQVSAVTHIANGASTAFAFGFLIPLAVDMVVEVDGVRKFLGVDYALSGVGSPAGGLVVFITAPVLLARVRLRRSIALSRATDYQVNGELAEELLDRDFDRLWLALQDLYANTPVLPPPIGLHLLGWDADAENLINYDSSDLTSSLSQASWVTQIFMTDGVNNSYPLARDPGNASNCRVTLGGVPQDADTDYFLVAQTIEFAVLQPAGLKVAINYGIAAPHGDGVPPTLSASDITDFSEAVDDRVAALLAAGANVTLTYSDATGQLTIAATGVGGGAVWGGITGDLTDQADVVAALDLKANLSGATFTGPVVLPATSTLNNPTITGFTETRVTFAAGSAFSPNLSNGTIFRCPTNANATITLPAATAGKSYVIEVAFGGAHTLAFAGGGTIRYAGGTAPVATSVNGKIDRYVCSSDGTNTFISDGGRNF